MKIRLFLLTALYATSGIKTTTPTAPSLRELDEYDVQIISTLKKMYPNNELTTENIVKMFENPEVKKTLSSINKTEKDLVRTIMNSLIKHYLNCLEAKELLEDEVKTIDDIMQQLHDIEEQL